MRPVTKGNPPNYLYWNVAAEQGNNETFATNSAVATVNNPPPGTVGGPPVTFTVEEVMEELLDKSVIRNPFPNPSTPRVRARAANAMRERLEVIYRGSKPNLMTMIGEFCSFCEMPVPGTILAVEHRAPKSIYPTYSVWWWNFLLVCRDCNSCKGSLPARATSRGWAIAAGHNPPNENDLVDAIKDHYYWPDLTTVTYQVIGRAYYYDTNKAAMRLLTNVDAASFDNVVVSYTMDLVRANIRSGGAMRNNRDVEVIIENNGGGADGTDTINLTGLQWQENPRSALRTRGWLTVCANLANLYRTTNLVTGGNNKRYTFNGIWVGILYLAVQTGYYSVWVDITDGYPFPAGMTLTPLAGTLPLQADLGAQFVFNTNPANNLTIGQTFLGTNVTNVP
jgi:hypothetical protein